MNLLALSAGEATLWWVALATGAVVIGVVIALFTLLARLLHDTTVAISALGETADRLERDGAEELTRTAALLRELREEIGVHGGAPLR